MYKCDDDLIFLQKRAEQLFDAGDTRAALRLIHIISQKQKALFEQTVNLLALERAEC